MRLVISETPHDVGEFLNLRALLREVCEETHGKWLLGICCM